MAPDPVAPDPVGVTAQAGSLADRLDRLERRRSVEVEARLVEARAVERLTAASGGPAHRRASLVVADMLHRVGEVAEAARLAVEVNTWAEQHGERPLLARSHLVLSSVLEGIGDTAAGLDHALRALDLVPDDAPPSDRGAYLIRLADALALTGSADRSRERYEEAETAFSGSGDEDLRLTVLNNLVVLEVESGDGPAAERAADRLLRLALDDELNADYADTIAGAWLLAGRYPEALQILAVGERLLREHGASRGSTPAELALTGAQVLLASGDVAGAAEQVERCLTICAERGLDGLRVRALAVRAEASAAAGDFEAAYRTHREFYAEAESVRSRQQEAAARTRQALFETAEARREAERFREQARTDPLTGLRNRRYVDEQLPRALAAVAGTGLVLTVAVLDVDHFKRVNDSFSHDIGDQVLQLLAAHLAGATGPAEDVDAGRAVRPGFAARLGGEEFLVVRTDGSAVEARARFEELRGAVQAHPWERLSPGLRVTISLGVAVAGPEDTQRSLLGRADHYLYEAKRSGRNRTLGDPA